MPSEQEVASYLIGVVGERHVVTDKEELKNLGCDWTKIYNPDPLLAVLPGTTEEVSKILSYCNEHDIKIVPSGGRTGLAGGAVASDKEIVISLNRMNKILDINPASLTAEVEAGVTTQALQDAAKEKGLFFPLDLAAKGTSQIGGNIATNAGGLKLIRYGGMREQVLGIEVVKADGSLLDLNTSLRKNNTGYDLKQLFIGSEGTLGIITKATVKLMPQPSNVMLTCMAVDSSDKIVKILEKCNLAGVIVTAFEFFTGVAHELVIDQFKQLKTPFESHYPYYVLLEVEQGSEDSAKMEGFLENLFEEEIVSDAVLAQSSQEFNDLWALRENITESLAAYGHVRKNDISVATQMLAPFIAELQDVFTATDENIKVVLFGHVGDGNIHINYTCKKHAFEFEAFNEKARILEEKVFELIKKHKGSISAEHGIGLLKVSDLQYSRSEEEISIMRSIKEVFDPKKIMNPGKIFTV